MKFAILIMFATLVAAEVADLAVNQQEQNSEQDYLIDPAVNQQEPDSEGGYLDDFAVNQLEPDSEGDYLDHFAVNKQEPDFEGDYLDDFEVNQQEPDSEGDYLDEFEVNQQKRKSAVDSERNSRTSGPTTEKPVNFCNQMCEGSKYLLRCNTRCLYTIKIKDVCFPIYEAGETNKKVMKTGIRKCKDRMQQTLSGAQSSFIKCLNSCISQEKKLRAKQICEPRKYNIDACIKFAEPRLVKVSRKICLPKCYKAYYIG